MKRRSFGPVVMVAVSATLASCGGSDVATPPAAEREGAVGSRAEVLSESPFPLAQARFMAAAGDDVVAVNLSGPSGATQSAVRLRDGTWQQLPDPPGDYVSVGVATVGESVVVAGTTCPAASCDGARLEFARLSDDLSKWTPFGRPVEIDVAEPEVVGLAGQGEVAYFSSSAGNFAVDADANVRSVAPSPDRAPGGSAICLVGTELIVVRSPVSDLNDPIDQEVSSVATLDLSDEESAWQEAPLPSRAVSSAEGGTCGEQGPILVVGDVQTAFDASNRTWSGPGPTGIDEEPQTVGSSALTGDGTVYALATTGTVLVREPTGRWSDTGTPAAALIGTSTTAFALRERGARTLEPLPVN